MAKTEADEDGGVVETGLEALNATADNLSGSDLEMLYVRQAQATEELVYEQNEIPFILRNPTFAQTQAVKDKISEEEQKRRDQAAEERRRLDAVSLEKYMVGMADIIAQENELLARAAAMQSQVEELRRELDEKTITVDGQKVYVQDDHFVDKDGNRVSEDVEAQARRKLKDHPNAATFDQNKQVEDAERQAQNLTTDVKQHLGQAQGNRDSGASLTDDQRRNNLTAAGNNLSHDQNALGSLGKAVGNATTAVKSPGTVGSGIANMIGGAAAAAPGVTTPLGGLNPGTIKPLPGDQISIDPTGKVAGAIVSQIKDIVFAPQKPAVPTTSYTAGIFPTDGKGDLGRKFAPAATADKDGATIPPAGNVAAKADTTKDKDLKGQFVAAVVPAANDDSVADPHSTKTASVAPAVRSQIVTV